VRRRRRSGEVGVAVHSTAAAVNKAADGTTLRRSPVASHCTRNRCNAVGTSGRGHAATNTATTTTATTTTTTHTSSFMNASAAFLSYSKTISPSVPGLMTTGMATRAVSSKALPLAFNTTTRFTNSRTKPSVTTVNVIAAGE
jgi:hypothetical protein